MGFWRDPERREAARARFEERMAIPILIAAALLTAVTLVLVLGDLSRDARRTLILVDGLIWLFFVVDYVVRFTLATRKKRFLRAEWLDLFLVVIPLLQPLRLFGALLRVARISAAWERTTKSTRRLMRHRLDVAIGWALGLVLIAGVITPLVEPESAKIKTFWDGVWWAVVTTTTVGYGDFVPESAIGRGIGFLLMLAGIGIIGMLTANIASIFISPSDEAEPAAEAPHEEITARLEAIERKLDALSSELTGNP